MRRERGLAPSIEAAVILPGLVALVGLIIVLGRIVMAQHDVEAVAANVARAASIARTHAEAKRLVDEHLALARSDVPHCRDWRADVDTSQLGKRAGSDGTVAVELRCTLQWADVALPGFDGTVQVVAQGVSPIDRHRGR